MLPRTSQPSCPVNLELFGYNMQRTEDSVFKVSHGRVEEQALCFPGYLKVCPSVLPPPYLCSTQKSCWKLSTVGASEVGGH